MHRVVFEKHNTPLPVNKSTAKMKWFTFGITQKTVASLHLIHSKSISRSPCTGAVSHFIPLANLLKLEKKKEKVISVDMVITRYLTLN